MFPISSRAVCLASASIFLLTGCIDQHRVSGDGSVPTRTDSSPRPEIRALVPTNSLAELPDSILAWDAKAKTYHAKAGEESASFTFNVTNVSPAEVVIEDTSTSCGCTVAELPADPWKLTPGAHGQIYVTMDFNGLIGDVTKEVMVITSKGNEVLTVECIIPEPVIPAAAK
jgi:hypothetical protein